MVEAGYVRAEQVRRTLFRAPGELRTGPALTGVGRGPGVGRSTKNSAPAGVGEPFG